MLFACKEESKTAMPLVEKEPIKEEKMITPIWLDIKYITGQFEPSDHPFFVVIDSKYADRADRIMRKEAYNAFVKMHTAAAKDGINLTIKSATRNFNYQKGIWERKWSGKTLLEGKEHAPTVYKDPTDRAKAILRYSSMPGTSRHHWGTDIDFNAFTNAYFESGQGLEEFKWLEKHAAEYGYCRPYTKKGTDRNSGYNEEKWHWSYRPIADLCTDFAKENLNNEMITGFNGSESASKIDIVENYILGISSNCK